MDFDKFVKTYDVRGLVGSELTPELIECFGAGFADELELMGKSLVVGHDMRDSSPGFANAFAQGANQARSLGCDDRALLDGHDLLCLRQVGASGGNVYRLPQSRKL